MPTTSSYRHSSRPDVQKQFAAIDDMISQKVDAILIELVPTRR